MYLLDDRPTKVPWKELNDLAEHLALNLPSYPSCSPILVSGEWGLGKTTLLHAIHSRLNPKTKGALSRVLLFEAWRYEGELPLMPAMVRSLWGCLGPQRQGEKATRDRWETLWKSSVALAAGMGAGLVAASPLGAVGQAVFSGLIEVWKSPPKPSKAERIEAMTRDETEDLWKAFHGLINGVWQDPDNPLIILIDDLDRCSPTHAISLLESIRIILTRSSSDDLRCRFVVALDREVISQAVARKFADLSRYEGNRYLEKIFPLSFDLPRPDPAVIDGLIKKSLASIEKDRKSQSSQLDVLHQGLSSPLFANPRLIKRCINRFLLLWRFEKWGPTNSLEDLHRRVVLVKWMAACERWPPLRRLLYRRDLAYWDQVRAFLSTPGGKLPDPDAEELLREQDIQSWMRAHLAEGAAPLREADDLLRRWGL